MTSKHYDTDLTDVQWARLKKLLPKPKKRGRKTDEKSQFLYYSLLTYWKITR